MPALYLPIILMLMALIFRGVAFEFRHHGRGAGKRFGRSPSPAARSSRRWRRAWCSAASSRASHVENGAFAGGPLDWLTPFSLLVAASLVAGYALLGAAWLVFKTQGRAVRARARLGEAARAADGAGDGRGEPGDARRRSARDRALGPDHDERRLAGFLRLAPLPLIAGALCFLLWRGARRDAPAAVSLRVALFAIGYLGLAISLWPYIVPFAMTPADAAAADNALALLLWGAAPMLPLILAYTAYVYWIFRAKVGDDAPYH